MSSFGFVLAMIEYFVTYFADYNTLQSYHQFLKKKDVKKFQHASIS